jgi:hypothetical protein
LTAPAPKPTRVRLALLIRGASVLALALALPPASALAQTRADSLAVVRAAFAYHPGLDTLLVERGQAGPLLLEVAAEGGRLLVSESWPMCRWRPEVARPGEPLGLALSMHGLRIRGDSATIETEIGCGRGEAPGSAFGAGATLRLLKAEGRWTIVEVLRRWIT